MTKAFSYLRFSSPEQIKGDSVRRQLEAAESYAAKHGLELDHATYRDYGVSAYHGRNAAEGKLSQFLEAIEKGTIQPGSYLLIENLDRLSRDRIMPALNRFASILEKGIIIVTLSDGKTFTADSLNNLSDLILSLLIMSRAHEESAIKSQRVAAAWHNKRDKARNGGSRITSLCPAWLKPSGDSFVILPEKAAIVRRIFDLALQGHGSETIARTLNSEGVPPITRSKGWHKGYVASTLNNPAVIGQFQPRTRTDHSWHRAAEGTAIEGYYPPIIEESTFYRVKHMRPRVGGKKGKPFRNALRGIAICSHCYSPITLVSKSPGGRGQNYSYLQCDHARRKLNNCTAKPVPYDFAYAAVIRVIGEDAISPSELLAIGENARSDAVAKHEAIAAQAAETETAIANLLDVLSRTPSKAIEARLADLERKLAIQIPILAAAKAAASEPANSNDPSEVIASLAQAVIDRADEQELGAIRVRVNAALKRLLDHIELYTQDYSPQSPEIGVAAFYRGSRDMVARVVAKNTEAPRNGS